MCYVTRFGIKGIINNITSHLIDRWRLILPVDTELNENKTFEGRKGNLVLNKQFKKVMEISRSHNIIRIEE